MGTDRDRLDESGRNPGEQIDADRRSLVESGSRVSERDRDQRVIERANGRDLECAARHGPGCQVQGPEDGGPAALGGYQPVARASEPAGGSAGPRAGSKQARVIGLLQRPEGATIDEIASATGWQRHTVRGLISGALKKKLGLHILSEGTDRGRLYRISEGRSAAR